MKTILLAAFLLTAGFLPAQFVSRDTIHESADSIGYMETICFDSNVVDFKYDYIYKGRNVTVRSPHRCYTFSNKLPKGTVLRFYDIYYEPKPGVRKKLPPRNYIVK